MSKRPKTAAASSSAKSATRKKADDNPPEFLINVLRDRIANHDLPPGSKLRENSISEEFGVSRARVREALRAAGARATGKRPLAWLSMEFSAESATAEIRLTGWPDAEPRKLGDTHPHGAFIQWNG